MGLRVLVQKSWPTRFDIRTLFVAKTIPTGMDDGGVS